MVPLTLGSDLIPSVRAYVQSCYQTIYEKMDEGLAPNRQVQLLSLMMDQLVTRLYRQGLEESHAKGVVGVPMAFFAQGGYGRAELNIYSDLDLLVIYEGKSSKPLEVIIKKMLYPLWDAGLHVGYSIRNLEECGRAMGRDIRVMSSTLDARFLGGDQEIARKFFRFLESKISSSRSLKQFIRGKMAETKDRLKRFGGSVYVIEPNLKESEGGLRDWHTLRYFARLATKSSDIDDWIRSGLVTNEEAEQIRRALNFFWEVRNRLHRLARKPQDQILFEFQKPLAKEMGYKTGEGQLEAEKFMQDYYSHAANFNRVLKEVTRRILKPPRSSWRRIKNRLRPSLSECFINVNGKVLPKAFRNLESNPVEMVRAFALAQKKKIEIDEDLKSYINRHLNLIDENFRTDPEVGRLMREMFSQVSTIGKTLEAMHDCRLLGALIPEFGEILHQTQHDVYHVYTVDSHSIKAVQELSDLKNGVYDKEFPVFKMALEEIKTPSHLVLGTLFHDIGKGKGGRHSEVGAKLAQRIMTRMGYPEEDRAVVEFLVLSHLIMPHLSQRRDLEDMNLINQFAKTVGDLEKLNLLFILTWADIRAVGPEVWTPWKGSLLRELYEKTRYALEKGEYTPERATKIMEAIKKKVLKLVPRRLDPKRLEIFMSSMPPRYFLATPPEEIIVHFELIDGRKDPYILFHQFPHQRGRFNELLLFTVNSPRLFEQVTGVLAANQVNIITLEQFFDNQGGVLLLLKVTDKMGRLIEEERRFENIEQDFQKVLSAQIPLEKYYEKRARKGIFEKKRSGKPSRVEIDQDVSPYYTVIDIFSDDRIGLLYDLAKAMHRLGLFVEVSKISTKVDQVSDAFYVKDIFGHKINDGAKIKLIRKTLLEVMEQGDGA